MRHAVAFKRESPPGTRQKQLNMSTLTVSFTPFWLVVWFIQGCLFAPAWRQRRAVIFWYSDRTLCYSWNIYIHKTNLPDLEVGDLSQRSDSEGLLRTDSSCWSSKQIFQLSSVLFTQRYDSHMSTLHRALWNSQPLTGSVELTGLCFGTEFKCCKRRICLRLV